MRGRFAVLVVLSLGLVSAPAATALVEQVPPSLVFVRNGDLHRITLDGSETVRLTATKAKEHSPAVSPDRLQVAFIRGDDELWIMDAASAQRRLLARRPPSVPYAWSGSPTWSPGGRTLYLHRVSQTPNEICGSIFRIGAQGGGLKRVTAGVVKGSLDTDPAVSPDGRRIAISSGDCQPGFGADLAVVDTAGRTTRDLRKLGRTPGIQIEPTWSPDGKRIAFVVEDVDGSGRSAVHVVNRDGSALRRITRWAFDTGDPEWSPDGAAIAFTGANGLYVVGPDGAGLTRIPSTKKGDASPSWLPRS